MKLINNNMYLFLIDEEVKIKEGVYYLTKLGNIYKETPRFFEDDEENERFSNRNMYKPVIAYYPLTKEAKELDLPLLPNPFEEEIDIEKLSYTKYPVSPQKRRVFVEGYKAAQSKVQYSLEDIKKTVGMARTLFEENMFDIEEILGLTEVSTHNMILKYSEEEIIQSLSTQQLPSEFIPEYEDIGYPCSYPPKEMHRVNENSFYVPIQTKVITNSEGKEELVGTYVY
ncbi:MAG: hypothetical protein E6R13_02055 [Spirochaetes bacterium]|nr:MAG: hypothetical protein E6R13_02055 [Spirochaetota bacterium]